MVLTNVILFGSFSETSQYRSMKNEILINIFTTKKIKYQISVLTVTVINLFFNVTCWTKNQKI